MISPQKDITSEVLTLGIMFQNSTSNTTSSVSVEKEDGDSYMFVSLHGYQVTPVVFCVNLVAVIMAVWIVSLNCLLIHTLIKCRAQLEVTDIFIYSLAVTDSLNGVLLFYNSLYNIINFQNLYECLTRFGLIQSMLMNSTGHISLLTINRYIKIVKPLEYKEIFLKRRMLILSGIVWIFSVTFGLSPLVGWHLNYSPPVKTDHTVCRYFGLMPPGFIAANVSLYWIPLILMIVLYARVSKIVWRHSREINAQNTAIGKQSAPFTSSSSWRFTKTVFTIIGVYFFCWLPTGVYLIVELSGALHHVHNTTLGNILTLTTSLGYINSLLNPIIYATKITCVRQRFHKVFCCKTYESQSTYSSRRQSAMSTNLYSISQNSSRRQSTDTTLTTSQISINPTIQPSIEIT